ncbi:MAG TPA: hypothetical protein PLA20_06750 [Bacilli bacterium]|nr:hypothetical protein [Acholeplasmataceae bacterium]OQB63126.1 MAG: hypothetical protein BWX94_00917 [Tenericutes bacterium ADurb.Bin140]HOE78287.1 hypothetical protein [Bacilli bacterium]HON64067.1 hypothetical protein [Bacilli bacterium]HOR96545.1 hypothetical protein [Bacilli bacterium]
MKEFNLSWKGHLLITILFGPIWGGVIRIIRGKVLIGLLYMLTLGFFGIVWVIDILTLIFQHNMVFLA